ncbi:MAG: hypothetical protein ABFD06_04065 [Smithella sp.]
MAKELDSDSEVVLNAEKVNWISPCGTILLADFAMKRLQRNKKVSIKMPAHNETKQYIISSGLLKITQSTNINDAIDANNIELRLLHRMEPMVPESLSDFIAGRANNVNEGEKYLLRMWITELLTNANDHAKSDFGFWVCGRYNPSDHNIRICVADSGIGIKQSLVNAGKLPKNIDNRYQGTIVSVMFNTQTMSGDERRAPDQTPFRIIYVLIIFSPNNFTMGSKSRSACNNDNW